MAPIKKRTFSISKQQASYIDKLVKSGAYASASEVVRDGLRLIAERDEAVERWLREEVAPTYDRIQKHPEELIPAEEVRRRLRAYHEERTKKRA